MSEKKEKEKEKEKEKDKEKEKEKEKEKVKAGALKFLSDDKDGIEVLLEGYDVGFANLLVEKLLEEKSVEFASVDYVHPTQRTPLLRVKGRNAKKSVAAALDELKREAKGLEFSRR